MEEESWKNFLKYVHYISCTMPVLGNLYFKHTKGSSINDVRCVNPIHSNKGEVNLGKLEKIPTSRAVTK